MSALTKFVYLMGEFRQINPVEYGGGWLDPYSCCKFKEDEIFDTIQDCYDNLVDERIKKINKLQQEIDDITEAKRKFYERTGN